MFSETYSCILRLKSSAEEDVVKMQPGSGETHVLYDLLTPFHPFMILKLLQIVIENFYSFPDSLGDDLIVEVMDSKGKQYGRVLAQLATVVEDQVLNFNNQLQVVSI